MTGDDERHEVEPEPEPEPWRPTRPKAEPVPEPPSGPGVRQVLGDLLRAPRRERLRDRRVQALLGTVAALLIVAFTVLPDGGDDLTELDPALKARFAEPDQVATGRVVTSIPQGCGLSERVRDRLAPRAGVDGRIHHAGYEECSWSSQYIGSGPGGGRRDLKVEIHKETPADGSPVADAINTLGRVLKDLDRAAKGAPSLVEGLGALAYAVETEPESPDVPVAVVLFQSGNTVVQVSYSGEDHKDRDGLGRRTGVRALGYTEARAGALTAATDVAATMRLGTGPSPRVAPARSAPPVARVPAACDLISPAQATSAGLPAKGTSGSGSLQPPGDRFVKADGCEWAYRADLDTALYPTSAQGPGVGDATREFLRFYQSDREDGPEYHPRDTFFRPLDGLGDQAYIAFGRQEDDDGEAVVMFRYRNVLVRVAIDNGGGPTDRNELLERAYAMARAAGDTLGA